MSVLLTTGFSAISITKMNISWRFSAPFISERWGISAPAHLIQRRTQPFPAGVTGDARCYGNSKCANFLCPRAAQEPRRRSGGSSSYTLYILSLCWIISPHIIKLACNLQFKLLVCTARPPLFIDAARIQNKPAAANWRLFPAASTLPRQHRLSAQFCKLKSKDSCQLK